MGCRLRGWPCVPPSPGVPRCPSVLVPASFLPGSRPLPAQRRATRPPLPAPMHCTAPQRWRRRQRGRRRRRVLPAAAPAEQPLGCILHVWGGGPALQRHGRPGHEPVGPHGAQWHQVPPGRGLRVGRAGRWRGRGGGRQGRLSLAPGWVHAAVPAWCGSVGANLLRQERRPPARLPLPCCTARFACRAGPLSSPGRAHAITCSYLKRLMALCSLACRQGGDVGGAAHQALGLAV